MKKDIAPEVLAFLKALPKMSHAKDLSEKGTITEEDEARIKTMLNNATDSQAQADRKALKQYILNSDFKNNTKITDADRKEMDEYLRTHAPEFFELLSKE